MGELMFILRHRRFLRLCLAALILSLFCAACQPAATPTPQALAEDDLWVRDPAAIIFRADVVGGSLPELARMSETPVCTIYGDNRVVWVNVLDSSTYQVLYDRVSDEDIYRFLDYLTVRERIYTHQAGLADIDLEQFDPVYQTVLINVGGLEHRSDSFSDWDVDWFNRVTDACKTISRSPVLFVPRGAWLTVQPAQYTIEAPLMLWEADEQGLSLAAIAASAAPRWIEGPVVERLWDVLTTQPASLILNEGDGYYRFALQVPGISRDAPAPP